MNIFRKIICLSAAFCFAAAMVYVNTAEVYAEDLSSISAKSAIVYAPETGDILFEKNAYEKLPMASTTKIMSALIVLEQDDIDEKFVVDSQAIQTEGSSMGLKEGDKVSLRDLACGMLLPSGNDAANAAAVRVAGDVESFVDIMNQRAKTYGLVNTHFVTPSGLDDYTDEHYSTAYDMALLASEAMKNQAFRDICGRSSIKLNFGDPPFDRWLTNSNKLLKRSDDITGVKTGFTDKAGRCLVSACKRNGTELICVTLNAPDDWNDHMKLYDRTFDFLSEQRIDSPFESIEVDVAGGTSDKVRCITESTSAVLLNGRASEVTHKIYVSHFLYAPVKKNDEVGRVEYYYNDRKISEKPILAAESVEFSHTDAEPSVLKYYWSKFKSLFECG